MRSSLPFLLVPALMLPALGMPSLVFGQARIVLNNDAWLRIDGGAWLVVEEPSSAGIQTLGTGGNIRSEGEFNRLRWNIGTSLGNYIIPFTTANGVKMPLSCQITSAGSNEPLASIAFSTYNYGIIDPLDWNNDLYRPSDVTHMNNLSTSLNNSDHVVDRFWIIDPGVAGYAYTARPDVELAFSYDPGAATGDVRTGNAITGATVVGAQRFNATTQQWGDMPPQGTFAAGPVNTVTGVVVSAANFHRSWTLSDITSPLPVELVRFEAECHGSGVRLQWSTASERDNDHFIIERSTDGTDFSPIGIVAGMGNSQNVVNYTFDDDNAGGLHYYRLRQVDLSGGSELGPTVVIECTGLGEYAFERAWTDGPTIHVAIRVPSDEVRSLSMIDAGGRLVRHLDEISLTGGRNSLALPWSVPAPGIYILRSDGLSGSLFLKVRVD